MSYLSEIKNSDQAWSDTSAHLVVVGIYEDQELTPLGQTIDKDLGGTISKAIEQKMRSNRSAHYSTRTERSWSAHQEPENRR